MFDGEYEKDKYLAFNIINRLKKKIEKLEQQEELNEFDFDNYQSKKLIIKVLKYMYKID